MLAFCAADPNVHTMYLFDGRSFSTITELPESKPPFICDHGQKVPMWKMQALINIRSLQQSMLEVDTSLNAADTTTISDLDSEIQRARRNVQSYIDIINKHKEVQQRQRRASVMQSEPIADLQNKLNTLLAETQVLETSISSAHASFRDARTSVETKTTELEGLLAKETEINTQIVELKQQQAKQSKINKQTATERLLIDCFMETTKNKLIIENKDTTTVTDKPVRDIMQMLKTMKNDGATLEDLQAKLTIIEQNINDVQTNINATQITNPALQEQIDLYHSQNKTCKTELTTCQSTTEDVSRRLSACKTDKISFHEYQVNILQERENKQSNNIKTTTTTKLSEFQRKKIWRNIRASPLQTVTAKFEVLDYLEFAFAQNYIVANNDSGIHVLWRRAQLIQQLTGENIPYLKSATNAFHKIKTDKTDSLVNGYERQNPHMMTFEFRSRATEKIFNPAILVSENSTIFTTIGKTNKIPLRVLSEINNISKTRNGLQSSEFKKLVNDFVAFCDADDQQNESIIGIFAKDMHDVNTLMLMLLFSIPLIQNMQIRFEVIVPQTDFFFNDGLNEIFLTPKFKNRLHVTTISNNNNTTPMSPRLFGLFQFKENNIHAYQKFIASQMGTPSKYMSAISNVADGRDMNQSVIWPNASENINADPVVALDLRRKLVLPGTGILADTTATFVGSLW